jgi:RecA/RadA recombinase
MKDNIFLDIIREADPDFDTNEIVTTGFIDTSAYMLNALISGSIYKGLPNNRSTMWAGDPSTGKTYLTFSTVRQFLKDNPTGGVIWFDSEFALDSEMVRRRGVSAERVLIQQPETLQEFRTKALNIIEGYASIKSKKKPQLMLVLDSLGQLPTKKEMEDSAAGSDTRDMTKAQIIKSIFRVLTLKMGKAGVPLIVTNHTYDSMSQYTPKAISGGSGAKYAASTIVMLGKSKDKDKDKKVVGNIIRATSFKSRFSKESQTVELKLSFETGLDRYYGLHELGADSKVLPYTPRKGYMFPDGSQHTEDEIFSDPTKFFTKDVLDRLDEAAAQAFAFGDGQSAPEVIENDDTEE